MPRKQTAFLINNKLKQIWENLIGFAQWQNHTLIETEKTFQNFFKLTAMVG